MDKALQREKTRERVKRYRERLKSVTPESVTSQSVTEYPAVIEALVDPVKRAKLEKIYHSLASHNVEIGMGSGAPLLI